MRLFVREGPLHGGGPAYGLGARAGRGHFGLLRRDNAVRAAARADHFLAATTPLRAQLPRRVHAIVAVLRGYVQMAVARRLRRTRTLRQAHFLLAFSARRLAVQLRRRRYVHLLRARKVVQAVRVREGQKVLGLTVKLRREPAHARRSVAQRTLASGADGA